MIGSKLDRGDEKARSAMDISIRDTQIEVRAKLFDIAYKRRDDRVSPELPGFKDVLRRWGLIEREVMDTLQTLGQRLEEKKSEETSEKKDKDDEKTIKKDKEEKNDKKTKNLSVKSTSDKNDSDDDEYEENEAVAIRWKDLDTLLNHMKNSWVEQWVAGEILYVNKFDTARTQWDRPTGYIKYLPRSSRLSSTASARESRCSSPGSWDLPYRRRIPSYDTWSDPSGW